MIDTVVLTLMEGKFTIMNHNVFSPSTENLFNRPYLRLGKSGYFQSVQNPTKTDAMEGNYKPRLTVIKRIIHGGYQIVLRIEFSIPKMLYGNNFDEVTVADFPRLIKILQTKLLEMSVIAHEMDLASAIVSTIHYSKNIILTDYSTPKMVLDEIRKANVSLNFDTSQTDYRNDGHLLKYHSNSFELVFYDKIKDLERAKRSDKRAVEKDNSMQIGLFDKVRSVKPFEVFRMEIRLNARAKIKSELGTLGFEDSLTFRELFVLAISKAVLLKHWQEITKYSPLSDQKPKSYSEYLSQVLRANPKLKLNKALAFIGTKVAVDEIGLRGYRSIISKFGKEAWYRLNKEFEKYNFPKSTPVVIPHITKRLQEFKTVRMADYGIMQ